MPTDRPTGGPSTHPDRAALADLDEGLLEAAAATSARLHLAGCPDCRDRLASIAGVRTALAAAPAEPLPAAVGARLDAALKAAHRPGAPAMVRRDPTPTIRRVRGRPGGGLLAAGAAASIVLLLVGALAWGTWETLHRGRDSSGTGADGAVTSAHSGGAAGGGVVTSGRNYTAATIKAAVPRLIAGFGRTPVPADALPGAASAIAGLGRAGALEPCVAELAGRSGVRPLAVDLARFAGQPAAVIVLPETGQPSTLDVWVVGPGCTRGDPQLVYFTRLSRPAGIRSP